MKFRRLLKLEALEHRSMLTTIFVESGAAGGDGSANAPFGAIQDAVGAAAAMPGDDTIMIAAGVYEENVEIDDDDALTLKGQGDVTIRHPVIDIPGGEEPEDVIEAEGDVTFQNLNIEGLFIGGDLGGRGIDAEDGSFTFLNIHISGTDGDALRVRDSDEIIIINGNFSSLNADGIDIEDSGHVEVFNTTANDNDNEGLEVDDVDSIIVSGGQFLNNGDDGVDIDNSTDIRVVNIFSAGNSGNGLQVEADDRQIQSIEVVGSRFEGNDENGVEIVDDAPGSVVSLVLTGNASNNNTESGYEVSISGVVVGRGNRASGNADDSLP